MTGRIDRVCARLADAGVDALLVSNLVNVRWLTGFSGSNGWVVLAPEGVALVTDGRYGGQAERQLAEAGVHAEVLVGLSGGEVMQHIARRCGRYARVGFESSNVTVLGHGQYVEAFAAEGVPTSLVAVNGVVEAERRTKDADEIDAIGRACAIADRALAEVAPMLGDRLTEAQVRNLLDQRMREFGADGPSYDTIVATGPVHAALPHHAPTHTIIEPGHTVIIDVGALVDGYHSDMTRSFVVGVPSQQQLEMYELVLAAQLAGVAAVRPGASTIDIDRACRQRIADAGFGDWFTHGTGHGVGLLIHEDPFLNRVTPGILQVGDVVTVEPGVYHEGFGGIRVEDLVVVTSDGCRVLTSSPKDSPCPQSPPTT